MGDASSREWLARPVGSGAFDAELPSPARRAAWPCNMQHPEDTSALGFAIEHAAKGATGPPEPPEELYRWEREP